MKIGKAEMDFERQNVSLSLYTLPDKIKKQSTEKWCNHLIRGKVNSLRGTWLHGNM